MSAFKKIKIIQQILLAIAVVSLVLSFDSLFTSDGYLWIFMMIFFTTLFIHSTVRQFVVRYKFSGDERINTMMPFTSLYNNATLLDAIKISFKSSIYLTIDGTLYYEVALVYDGYAFNETSIHKSVPIKLTLFNWYKVTALDNEYFYKHYHAPIALELIREVCNGSPLKSNSIKHNMELAASRVDALRKEFGAA